MTLGPDPDQRKEIHLSITVGPVVGPDADKSERLIVDWDGGMNSVPTGTWRSGHLHPGADADTNAQFTIESGYAGHHRSLRIPQWSVGNPPVSPDLDVLWRDQDPTPREGHLNIPHP
jgi:hypothetical protein